MGYLLCSDLGNKVSFRKVDSAVNSQGISLFKMCDHYTFLTRGSFGSIFIGILRANKSSCIIKVCSYEDFDSELHKSVMNEIKAMKSCEGSEYIVKFYDVFYEVNWKEAWLVMEHCIGSLDTILKEIYSLKLSEKLEAGKDSISLHFQLGCSTISQGLKGLKFLHSITLIHRDIKLSNFILSFEGIIKICDFGTCSFAKESCSLVGTLHYLAPEVIDLEENDSYGPKVDCWSLGITALEIFDDPPGLNLVMKNENIPKIIKEIINDMLNKLPNERPTSSDLLVKLSNSSLDLQDDRIILRKIIYCLSNRHKNGVLKRLKLSFDASKNLLNNPVILENSEEFQDLKRIPSKRIVSAENCKTYSEIKSIIYRKNEKLKKIGSRVKLEKNNFIKDTETVHKKYSAIKMKELSKIKEEYMSKIKINQDRYHKCIQEFNGPIFNSLISKNNQFRHRSLLRNFDHLFTDKTIDIKHINIKNAVQQIIKSKYSEIQLKNEKEYLESISNIDISIINLYRDKWKLIKIDNNKILKKLYEEKRLVRLISIEKAFSCIIFDLEKMMKENKISPSTKSNIGLKEKLKPIFRILSASVFIPCREGNIKNFTEKLTNLHCSNMEVYQLLMQNTEFEASSDLKDKLQECLESTEILKNDVEDKYKNLIKKLDKELVEGEKKFEGQISEIRKDVRNKITAESEKYFIEANNATLSCQKFLNHRASLVSAAQCIYSDLLEKL